MCIAAVFDDWVFVLLVRRQSGFTKIWMMKCVCLEDSIIVKYIIPIIFFIGVHRRCGGLLSSLCGLSDPEAIGSGSEWLIDVGGVPWGHWRTKKGNALSF